MHVLYLSFFSLLLFLALGVLSFFLVGRVNAHSLIIRLSWESCVPKYWCDATGGCVCVYARQWKVKAPNKGEGESKCLVLAISVLLSLIRQSRSERCRAKGNKHKPKVRKSHIVQLPNFHSWLDKNILCVSFFFVRSRGFFFLLINLYERQIIMNARSLHRECCVVFISDTHTQTHPLTHSLGTLWRKTSEFQMIKFLHGTWSIKLKWDLLEVVEVEIPTLLFSTRPSSCVHCFIAEKWRAQRRKVLGHKGKFCCNWVEINKKKIFFRLLYWIPMMKSYTLVKTFEINLNYWVKGFV